MSSDNAAVNSKIEPTRESERASLSVSGVQRPRYLRFGSFKYEATPTEARVPDANDAVEKSMPQMTWQLNSTNNSEKLPPFGEVQVQITLHGAKGPATGRLY